MVKPELILLSSLLEERLMTASSGDADSYVGIPTEIIEHLFYKSQAQAVLPAALASAICGLAHARLALASLLYPQYNLYAAMGCVNRCHWLCRTFTGFGEGERVPGDSSLLGAVPGCGDAH